MKIATDGLLSNLSVAVCFVFICHQKSCTGVRVYPGWGTCTSVCVFSLCCLYCVCCLFLFMAGFLVMI